MTGLPTVQILLDDGTGTFPYDITTRARVSYTVSRGRQDEQSSVSPGQCTLILDNIDGRFTLGSTVIASPSPIKADQKIRVKVTANAVTRNRFTGYVQQWPVEWPSGSDAEALVSVLATDVQARSERWPLKAFAAQEALSNNVSAFFPLDDPEEAIVAEDVSGNNLLPMVQAGGVSAAAVIFDAVDGPAATSRKAPSFPGGKALVTRDLSLTATPGFVVAFNTTSTAGGFILVPDTGSPNNDSLRMNAIGGLLLGTTAIGSGGYNDGLWHVVGLRMTGALTTDVYIDGVLTNSGVTTVNSPSGTQVYLGGDGKGAASYVGSIAQFVAWSAAPSAAVLLEQVFSVLTGFAGETVTDRVTRLAGYAGLPLGALDATTTPVPAQETDGKFVAEALRDVADAELGLIFVDGSGNFILHGRNRPASKTAPDITITADVLDPGTAFQYDMQGVINYFEVTAAGTKITQIVRNAASELAHGRYPQSKTYLLQTDAEAFDRATWMVANHAEPAPRLGSMTIDLLALDAATQSSLLAAEPNTWIQVTGLPSQTPGGTTANLMVQGFSEPLSKDSWSITFNVINRSIYGPVWILGDATYGVLDSTTKLYV